MPAQEHGTGLVRVVEMTAITRFFSREGIKQLRCVANYLQLSPTLPNLRDVERHRERRAASKFTS
jgi:hypothetical protein